MLSEYTPHQERIMKLATGFLVDMKPIPSAIPMFGRAGKSLSVALTYTEGAHNYIVRETIAWFASKQHIFFACSRLSYTLAQSYAKTKHALEVSPDSDCWGK